MTGATSRDRGNRYERELCPVLTDALDVEVITSRNGRGGAQGGSDFQSWDGGLYVPHVRGWALDAKDVKNRQVPTWLRQVRVDAAIAGVDWFAVMHRTRGTGDRTLDRVYLPTRMLLDFLIYQEPTAEQYAVEPYLELSLGEWCEVAS